MINNLLSGFDVDLWPCVECRRYFKVSKDFTPVGAIRQLDHERFTNAAHAAMLKRTVFLAGPYMKINKPPRKNSKDKAVILRFHLYNALNDTGWIVTMGEYQKLVEATEPLLGAHNNAALAEIKHARESADAIVILPSSPGSFLELGAFSSLDDICSKMLIIIDAQYKGRVNYLTTGPLKGAEINGAKVHYIDYSNHSECWDKVDEFVTFFAQKKAAKQILTP